MSDEICRKMYDENHKNLEEIIDTQKQMFYNYKQSNSFEKI